MYTAPRVLQMSRRDIRGAILPSVLLALRNDFQVQELRKFFVDFIRNQSIYYTYNIIKLIENRNKSNISFIYPRVILL